MIAFFPIGHEDGRFRKIPFITIALILACVILFIATEKTVTKQQKLIAAAQSRLDSFRVSAYMQVKKGNSRDIIGAMVDKDASNFFELGQKMKENVESFWLDFTAGKIVAEDDPLFQQYLELKDLVRQTKEQSLIDRYGLVPGNPSVLTFFTCMFMHGSLAHLFFNMFFLFLFGIALEEVWGKGAYLIFYLAAGVAASAMHIAFSPGSMEPVIGASGAISGLMGAFLVRFFRTKIHFVYYYFLLRLHYGKFSLPAFVFLPAWFLKQVLFAWLTTGSDSEVAFWAHLGGFAFGAVAATLLAVVGFGNKSLREQDREELEQLKAAPVLDLNQGRDLLRQGRMDEALEFFENVLEENPTHLPARQELFDAQFKAGKKGEIADQGRVLIDEYLAAGNATGAASVFSQLREMNIQHAVTPRTLMQLAAYFEEQWENERAVETYLATAATDNPAKGKALLKAAQITGVRLRNKADADKLYQRIFDELPGDPIAEFVRNQGR